MSDAPGPDHFLAAAEFVLMLRQAGLQDTAVLRAMEQVPRVPFVDRAFYREADMDIALPIAMGQSILAPSMTARLISAADVRPGHRVLEVGAGSGYGAAILGRLAQQVIAIERWRLIADEAHARLRELGYRMVEVIFGDGLQGYPPRAPYDRIIFTCAIAAVPSSVLAQLRGGGAVVAPILVASGGLRLMRYAADGAIADLGSADWVGPAVPGITLRL